MCARACTHTIWAKAGPGQGEERGPESGAGMKASPGASRGKGGFDPRWEGQCLHWPAKARGGGQTQAEVSPRGQALGLYVNVQHSEREAGPPGGTPGAPGMPRPGG